MAEEIAVELHIGPFPIAQKDQVTKAIEPLTEKHWPEFEPTLTEVGDGQAHLSFDLGACNYGTLYIANDGRLKELIELGVPYILLDHGKSGFRTGNNYSWHPSYGDEIKIREEDGFGNLMLTEARLATLGARSNEEIGKAVRGYFATPGTDEANAGWEIWNPDYTPAAIKARRVWLQAFSELPKAEGYDPNVDVDVVMTAVNAEEPAVHLVGDVDGGFTAFGPYESNEHAIEQHDPELEQVLTIFDRDLSDDEQLTADDISRENYGAIWCWGNLADGFSARGIYRDLTTAVDANDGRDGFVVALAGPLP